MSPRREFRETWDSEKCVIDNLVEAVEAGEGVLTAKLADRLLQGYAENDWRRRELVASGLILPASRLDPASAKPEEVVAALDDADISDERLQELSQGARMTASEAAIWREHVLDWAFLPELVYELGTGIKCVVIKVKHTDGRCAHIAVTEWDGETGTLVAVYSTYTEAVNALKSSGITDMDDCLVWEDWSK